MTNKNVIVLLSGGLDSLVSISILKQDFNIIRALHINYGQKPYKQELQACKKICNHYKIDLEVINIDWYSKISKDSALNKENNNDNEDKKSYWMPNRNGLFTNIAASYADALNCKYIAIGANKEEAQEYSDNSIEFVNNSTKLFETATKNKVKLIAPLIEMDKKEIIQKAIDVNAPLTMIWSCYEQKEKHCGECPSCKFLKNALQQSNKQELIDKLF